MHGWRMSPSSGRVAHNMEVSRSRKSTSERPREQAQSRDQDPTAGLKEKTGRHVWASAIVIMHRPQSISVCSLPEGCRGTAMRVT